MNEGSFSVGRQGTGGWETETGGRKVTASTCVYGDGPRCGHDNRGGGSGETGRFHGSCVVSLPPVVHNSWTLSPGPEDPLT